VLKITSIAEAAVKQTGKITAVNVENDDESRTAAGKLHVPGAWTSDGERPVTIQRGSA